MRKSFVKGVSFGITTAVITTLGMIIGLEASTHSKMVVGVGILLIAFSDALSDSVAMHISEEAGLENTQKQIWESTAATFAAKIGVGFSFLIPIFMIDLNSAILINLIWGFMLIIILSYFIGVREKMGTYKVILEHLAITTAVIGVTYVIGSAVPSSI